MHTLRHWSRFPSKSLFALALLVAFATVVAFGPASGAAMAEEPPAERQPPQLVFEPDHYDFGLVQVNSGAQATLQLRNAGAEQATIDLNLVGPGTESIWIGNSNCNGTTLQPGQSCFVQIYFSPHNATDYAAQVQASVESHTFTADVSGSGGRAIFSPASNPVDFGAAAVGSAGTTREITVSNVGNASGGLFIAVVSGGAVGSYELLDENCTGYELRPAATCTLQVRFQPLSEGVKTATLSLFGEQDGGTRLILTGVGSAAQPVTAPLGGVQGPGIEPDVQARPKRSRHRPRSQHGHRRASVGASRLVARAR